MSDPTSIMAPSSNPLITKKPINHRPQTAQAADNLVDYLWPQNGSIIDKAILPGLRNSNHLSDPATQPIWQYLFKFFPDYNHESGTEFSYQQTAAYLGLKCWALYQQGSHDSRLNQSGPNAQTLFATLGTLAAQHDSLQKAIGRQVSTIFSTNSIIILNQLLPSLVTRLKGEYHKLNQPLPKIDFDLLISQITTFQFSPLKARQINLRWADNYYSQFKITEK